MTDPTQPAESITEFQGLSKSPIEFLVQVNHQPLYRHAELLAERDLECFRLGLNEGWNERSRQEQRAADEQAGSEQILLSDMRPDIEQLIEFARKYAFGNLPPHGPVRAAAERLDIALSNAETGRNAPCTPSIDDNVVALAPDQFALGIYLTGFEGLTMVTDHEHLVLPLNPAQSKSEFVKRLAQAARIIATDQATRNDARVAYKEPWKVGHTIIRIAVKQLREDGFHGETTELEPSIPIDADLSLLTRRIYDAAKYLCGWVGKDQADVVAEFKLPNQSPAERAYQTLDSSERASLPFKDFELGYRKIQEMGSESRYTTALTAWNRLLPPERTSNSDYKAFERGFLTAMNEPRANQRDEDAANGEALDAVSGGKEAGASEERAPEQGGKDTETEVRSDRSINEAESSSPTVLDLLARLRRSAAGARSTIDPVVDIDRVIEAVRKMQAELERLKPVMAFDAAQEPHFEVISDKPVHAMARPSRVEAASMLRGLLQDTQRLPKEWSAAVALSEERQHEHRRALQLLLAEYIACIDWTKNSKRNGLDLPARREQIAIMLERMLERDGGERPMIKALAHAVLQLIDKALSS